MNLDLEEDILSRGNKIFIGEMGFWCKCWHERNFFLFSFLCHAKLTSSTATQKDNCFLAAKAYLVTSVCDKNAFISFSLDDSLTQINT
jgi:hypothetical protein